MHPEIQEKAYEEMANILPDDQTTITADSISKLIYTDQIVKETLRLFPTVPLITRIARHDMKIGKNLIFKTKQFRSNYWISVFPYPSGEHNIPTGTEFIMSIFDLHREPSIWGPNANKFDPNNFLPENIAGKHPHAFSPFAFGTRNCVGKNVLFACAEQYREFLWQL